MSEPDRDHLDDGVDMTFEERRVDELTRAPKSDPEDAAPRVTVEHTDGGNVRIHVADTAAVRPGGGRPQH
jgi:hypothetical protein